MRQRFAIITSLTTEIVTIHYFSPERNRDVASRLDGCGQNSAAPPPPRVILVTYELVVSSRHISLEDGVSCHCFAAVLGG
jgi:hypothetical protein